MFDGVVLFVFLLIGLFLASKSPMVVRFDRKQNSCTRESKLIWEKHYHVEKLCDLKNIKSVKNEKAIFNLNQNIANYLVLKDGSRVDLFLWPWYSKGKNYNQDLVKIQNFLTNKKQNELVLKDSIPFFIGVCFTIIGILGICIYLFG